MRSGCRTISPSNLLIKLSGKKKKTLDFHGGVSQIFGPTLHAIIHGHQRHILLIRERHFYITEQSSSSLPLHWHGTVSNLSEKNFSNKILWKI